MEEKLTVRGTVSEIIYNNEQNGYTVCEIALDSEDIVMVGTIPYLMVGEEIVAQGEYVVHSAYGRQFKMESCERSLPKTSEAMREFLASGSIRGIGEVLAKRIVDKFGEQTFDIISHTPEELSTISGITKKKAKEIGELFNFRMGMKRIIEEFTSYGLGADRAVKAYQRFGEGTLAAFNNNPYIVCMPGIDVPFEVADEIAAKLDIDMSGEERIRAALIYCLTRNMGNGHTYLPKHRLGDIALSLVDCDEEILYSVMDKMFEEGEIIILDSERHECVFLARLYSAESYVAAGLCEMADNEMEAEADLDGHISRIEEELGIEYAAMQREAIKRGTSRGLMVLTGGPGTGKTTTVNAMIKLFSSMGKKIALTAPTGRAAQRMSQLCGYEAKTIHRLLEVKQAGEELTFHRNESNPLPADVIIVDECSMVDIILMEALMRGIKKTARLILVGDYNQLPSVGPGNVLKDIIESECVDVVELDEIFRQAAQSNIVISAHEILGGEYPIIDRKEGDLYFIQAVDEAKAAKTVASLVSRRLPRAYGYDPFTEIQVITPTKIGMLGTKELNSALQEALNGEAGGPKLRRRDILFKVGDKVMQTRNNYDIEWISPEDGRGGTGVFNGDIGRVASINMQKEFMAVDYGDRVATYPFELLLELELAYAITVHKSQGSEFQAVILPLYQCPMKLQSREILYTAFTRARDILIVVGDYGTITRMVDNKRHSKRYTLLREMIRTIVFDND